MLLVLVFYMTPTALDRKLPIGRYCTFTLRSTRQSDPGGYAGPGWEMEIWVWVQVYPAQSCSQYLTRGKY